jgi:hypothetical protein
VPAEKVLLLVFSAVVGLLFLGALSVLKAQTNSGTIQGTVTDPSKAAIPGAKVRIVWQQRRPAQLPLLLLMAAPMCRLGPAKWRS